MTNPLWNHWLRVKRADEHRAAIHDRISEFIEGQPYGVSYDFHSPSREVSISVERVNPTADDQALRKWGVAVGDFVHQLRSALDNLVWTLTDTTKAPQLPGRNPLLDVSFPIVTDAEAWSRASARRLWGVPDESLPVFRDLQPFVTGMSAPEREPLAMLNALWNTDKHRTIPLLSIDLVLPDINNLPPEIGIRQVFQYEGPLEDGREVLRLSYPEGIDQRDVAAHLDHHLGYTFEVAFDQMPPWIPDRTLIMKTLDFLEDATTATLLKFDPYFK